MSNSQNIAQLLKAQRQPRKQVGLNIRQPEDLGIPQARAGQFTVQTAQVQESNLGRLTAALGHFAAFGLRERAAHIRQQNDELEPILQSLAPEEVEALGSGDVSKVEEMLKNTENELDKAQRRKLLKFAENPNNYVRSQKLIGSLLANRMLEDFEANPDEFTKTDGDVKESLRSKSEEVAATFGLTGATRQGFFQTYNSRIGPMEVAFQQENNEYREEIFKMNLVEDATDQITSGNLEGLLTSLDEHTNGMDTTEVKKVLTKIGQRLIDNEDYAEAASYIEALSDEGFGIKVGTANVPDEIPNALSEYLEQQSEEKEKIQSTEADKLHTEINTQVVNNAERIARGDPTSPIEITLANGTPVKLESGADDLAGYVTDIQNQLYQAENHMNIYEFNSVVKLGGIVEQAQLANQNRFDTSEAPKMLNRLEQLVRTTNQVGQPISGMSVEEGDNHLDNIRDEVMKGIEAIYADPAIATASAKETAVRDLIRDVERRETTSLRTQAEAVKTDRATQAVLSSLGATAESQLQSRVASQFIGKANPATGLVDDTPEKTAYVLREAEAFQEDVMKTSLNIWNAPLTPEERALNDPALVAQNRKTAITSYALTRKIEVLSDIEKGLEKLAISGDKPKYEDLTKLRDTQTRRLATLQGLNEYNEAPPWMESGRAYVSDLEVMKATLQDIYEQPAGRYWDIPNWIFFKAKTRHKEVYRDVVQTKRVLQRGEAPFTIDELNSGLFDGFLPMRSGGIDRPDPLTDAIIPMSLIENDLNGVDDEGVRSQVKAYLTALDHDDYDANDPNVQKQFMLDQIDAYQTQYGMYPNTDVLQELLTAKE